jgi:hypothetical protein
LTTIDSKISANQTIFLTLADVFTGNNQFVGTQTFAGPTKTQYITMFNGLLTTQGITTPATSPTNGVISTLGGFSANNTSFFNGITGIYHTITIKSTITLVASQLTINQCIFLDGGSTVFTLTLSDPTYCDGQTIYIYNGGSAIITIGVTNYQTQNYGFCNKTTGGTFTLANNQSASIIAMGGNRYAVMTLG